VKTRMAVANETSRSIQHIDKRAASARKTPPPRWKCGASLALPLVDEPWNEQAAQASIFKACSMDTPWPSAPAHRGFLVYDSASATLKSSYKFPFARVDVDGALVAVPAGLAEAGRALEACDLPAGVKAKALAVIGFYRDRVAKPADEGGRSMTSSRSGGG
jgi:hypothetical protein